MATSARAASPAKTRKARTVAAVQASTNLINNGSYTDNLTGHRTQWLIRDFGLSGRRARVVADLFWEAAHG
jgi:hypothetical protein